MISAKREATIKATGADDWTTFENRVSLQEKWKTDYGAKLDTLKGQVTSLNKAFGDGGYQGSLVQDLEVLKSLIDGELGPTVGADAEALVTEMEARLAQFLPALHAADDTPDAIEASVKAREALVADQTEALIAKEAEEKAKTEFEAALEAARLHMDSIRIRLDERDEDIDPGIAAGLDTCDEMMTSASESGEKTKDYATAKQIVAAARRDMDAHFARATGANFEGLKDIAKFWRTGAGEFHRDITRLKAGLRSSCSDEEKAERDAQLKKIDASLDALVALFPSDAFNASAAKFEGDIGKTERKREREVILKRVHMFRAIIMSNPVFRAATGNPFNEAGVGSALYAQLGRIELETLRTV